jgi:peptidoglycan/xylan/chitin deacetylase (PgdA/CDA1 family)
MVSNEPNGFYPEIATSNFKKQMRYITNNYSVISLDEIVQRVRKKESIRCCVAITFDDGFRDNYEIAFPILKKYRIPATIFLSTGYMDCQKVPWFLIVRYIFMKSMMTEVSFSPIWKDINMPMKTLEQKFEGSSTAIDYLKYCLPQERNDLIERLSFELGVNEFEDLKSLMLAWNQIQEMQHYGITFGAHTVNHPMLSQIPIDSAKREILESKETIEKKIGKPVITFAYPFGKRSDYDPRIFSLLKKFEFSCALTTEKYPNRPGVNLFELNRSQPWELSLI